jgi:molecular chaperone Hsp33
MGASQNGRTGAHDRVVRGLLGGGAFRLTAARLTHSVREAARMHQLPPAPARVLGEALISTAIVALPMKTHEKYSLSVHGDAKMRSLQTDFSHEGALRGYIRLREGHDPGLVDEHDLMAPPGVLVITRSLPGRVTYQAITELRLGAISADLALHLSTSDQIETEIRVYLAGTGTVEAAGGLLVQAMPGADLDAFVEIRRALGALESCPPADLVERPEDLVSSILGAFEPRILEETPVRLQCSCSRERVENIFRQLPSPALLELTAADGSAFAECHWCNGYYYFSAEEMAAFFQARTGGGLPN